MRRRPRAGLAAAAVALVVAAPAGCRRDRQRAPPAATAALDGGLGGGLGGGIGGATGRDAPVAADPIWFPADEVIAGRVAELAGPALRGRGSGSEDEAAAADKLAAWFQAAGLEPAGADGGYLQPFARDGVTSRNVIGVVRGSDPHAAHVVIGAHFDHLGVDGTGAIYPGADDNASGVAGLAGIAAALTRAGQRPRRTVVLVGFGAEENGLNGSAWYAAHPFLPLDACALMINLDMIGRARFLSARDYAMAHALVPDDAIGALTSPGARDLVGLARAGAAPEGRPIVAASDFGPLEELIRPAVEYRGDHASFAAAGVRYLWLSTSMHDDYHRPTDTADKVDPATIAAVGRIVVRVVRDLPDRPPPPAIAVPPDAGRPLE